MKGLVKENSPRDKEKRKKDNKQKQTEPSELSRLATARNEPSRDESSRVESSHKTNWSSHDPLAMECKIYPKGRHSSAWFRELKSIQARAQWKIYAWRDGFPLPKKRRNAEIRKILNHLNEMHAKDNARGWETERESQRETWYEMSMIWIPLTENNNNEIKQVKNYNCHNSKSHFHCSRAFSRRVWVDMKIIVMQICPPPPLSHSLPLSLSYSANKNHLSLTDVFLFLPALRIRSVAQFLLQLNDLIFNSIARHDGNEKKCKCCWNSCAFPPPHVSLSLSSSLSFCLSLRWNSLAIKVPLCVVRLIMEMPPSAPALFAF